MKALISILIVLVVGLGIWKVWDYWDRVSTEREAAERAAKRETSAADLGGMPYQLERTLEEATKQGPAGLKAWIDKYKAAGAVKDPRLAWIELDYVVMISRENPLEAKRIFKDIKQRTPPESPISKRIKSLEKTYE
jgi:hypothetical protein